MNLSELFQDKKSIFGVVMTMIMFANTNSVYAQEISGTINGHDYVDLGLSVKWATCNVGAGKPSDYGNYYAWGETKTKETYAEENSKTFWKSMDDIAGNPKYDAARANWGGSWRMPTMEELEELFDKCTWIRTTQDGHNGYIVTGLNGNSIFLPAAGSRGGYPCDGSACHYWGSNPFDGYSNEAYQLGYGEENIGGSLRFMGKPVHPVTE